MTRKFGPLDVSVGSNYPHGYGYTVTLYGKTVSTDCGYETALLAQKWADAAVEQWAHYFEGVAALIRNRLEEIK